MLLRLMFKVLDRIRINFVRKVLAALLFLVATCLGNSFCSDVKQPKMLVLTSKAGNAHTATCGILKEIFPDYEIKFINPIHDFLHKSLAFDGEDWFINSFQKGWTRSANFIMRYPGQMYFKMCSSALKKQLLKSLEQDKPDILVSVIPVVNYPASWAAQSYNIPFLLITLDADLTMWIMDMQKCKNHDFIMTVKSKTPLIEKQLRHKHIMPSCVREVGAPLRKDFFAPKDLKKIRKEWNIPDDKKVVMLIRGGTGSNKQIDYLKSLVKIKKSIHVLVCIGKNTKIIPKINRIKATDYVSYSIVPFTPKISDLMAIADVLISQPSPTTCNEAIHMKLPIVVDMTYPSMFWEAAAIDWIKQSGFVSVVKRMSKLNAAVLENLDKKQIFQAQATKPQPLFNTEIRNIVEGLLKRK